MFGHNKIYTFGGNTDKCLNDIELYNIELN